MRVPDDGQVAKLTKALMAGTPAKDSCLYAGVSFEDYSVWRDRGRRHQQALADPDQDTVEAIEADEAERPYLQFLEATDQAIAAMKVACTVAIHTAVRADDWRAAAWMLERRDPENFGRRMLQPVTPDGAALPGDVEQQVGRMSLSVLAYARKNELELESSDVDDDQVVEATIVEP